MLHYHSLKWIQSLLIPDLLHFSTYKPCLHCMWMMKSCNMRAAASQFCLELFFWIHMLDRNSLLIISLLVFVCVCARVCIIATSQRALLGFYFNKTLFILFSEALCKPHTIIQISHSMTTGSQDTYGITFVLDKKISIFHCHFAPIFYICQFTINTDNHLKWQHMELQRGLGINTFHISTSHPIEGGQVGK